ncbi:XapX domain-containing protein [Salinithrix halophila]|uniref:XapX domain-containing protein n=1 Tax=Salinithrix halophila TaxID=1485204 RepID=A0ABV8JEA4_9BACL
MKIYLLSLLTGGMVGLFFALLRLPIPAPPALSGILGIFGIYLGYKVVEWAGGADKVFEWFTRLFS